MKMHTPINSCMSSARRIAAVAEYADAAHTMNPATGHALLMQMPEISSTSVRNVSTI